MEKFKNSKTFIEKSKFFSSDSEEFSCARNMGYTSTNNDKVTIVTYKPHQVNIVSNIYNDKNQLVGIDVFHSNPIEKKVIYNRKNNTTIVILKDDNKKFKGVAKCCKSDLYNPQIGYEIAYFRAKIKSLEYKLSNRVEGE